MTEGRLRASGSDRSVFPIVLATWFGCGFFPWGPGTVGSLAGVLIAYGLSAFCGAARPTYLVLTLVLLWPAIWAATRTARAYNKTDPGLVVIDEVLGVWVTLLGAQARSWKVFLAALRFVSGIRHMETVAGA